VGKITAPELLTSQHDLQAFDCGKLSLNNWLKQKALKAQQIGGSARTYVVCSPANCIVGYCALATGAVRREDAPGRVRKNTPNPIPAILLGRLAVDHQFRGQGIGSGLLKDAFMRAVVAAEQIGVRVILTHALDEDARQFYLKHGLYESPTNHMTLMVTISEIERTLGLI